MRRSSIRQGDIVAAPSPAATAAESTPTTSASGGRGQGVGDLCAPRAAEAHVCRTPRVCSRNDGRSSSSSLTVPARDIGIAVRPKREDTAPRSAIGHRRHRLVVGVEHRGAARRQRLDQLALGRGHVVDGAEHLGVRPARPRSRRRPSGGRPSHSKAMWPIPRAPISTTAASVPSGALISVSGTPSSLLNARSLARDAHRRPAPPRRGPSWWSCPPIR